MKKPGFLGSSDASLCVGVKVRLQFAGGEADAEAPELHPEVAEFVRWFPRWWITRGLKFAREDNERNAA